jgi:hypothetical protein
MTEDCFFFFSLTGLPKKVLEDAEKKESAGMFSEKQGEKVAPYKQEQGIDVEQQLHFLLEISGRQSLGLLGEACVHPHKLG